MNVLFLSYSFPPANLASTPRAWNIARVLAEQGTVNVVTMRADAWRKVNPMHNGIPSLHRIEVPARLPWLVPWELKTSNSLAHRVGRAVARRVGVDHYYGWRIEAEKAAHVFRAEDVDVILATGGPFASFGIAHRTALRLGKPFVLDYRDLWTSNPHFENVRTLEEERAIVRDAAAVIAVSPSLVTVLDRHHHVAAKSHVLTNGFDEEEMSAVVPRQFDHFAVVYTGMFYPPKRVIDPVLAALRLTRGIGWRFHYAGPQADMVMRAASEQGVADSVTCYGDLPRKESLALTAGANVAVTITTVYDTATDSDRGIVTSKIFDILGTQRPMLVVTPPGSDVETIVAGRAATACLPGTDPAAIAAFFERLASSHEQPAPALEYSWRRRGDAVRGILQEAIRR